MAGGGVAFSQALENQGEAGIDPSEPVVKYGTGGRIGGFAGGGGIKDLAMYGRNGDTICTPTQ